MSEEIPFQRLERIFHEPARLAILALLIQEPEGLGFTALRDRLGLTFGNLDRHLKALTEAEIVEVEKRVGKGRPQSIIRFADSGRTQFLSYLSSLEQVLKQVSPDRVKNSDTEEGLGGLVSPA